MSEHARGKRPHEAFGEQLRRLRLAAYIDSQVELLDAFAEEGLAYDAAFWSRVESGLRRPARDALVKILRFFHRKGVLETTREAQALMQLAGYANLDSQETLCVFGDVARVGPGAVGTAPPHPPLREPTTEARAVTLPPCPYQGLFAFREQDAPVFFGRELITERLVKAVTETSLVAVVGPSGSGKSSLVFAGLLPRLRLLGAARSAGDKTWCIASVRPSGDPFYALAAELARLREPKPSEAEWLGSTRDLVDTLRRGDTSLADVIVQILTERGGSRLVLIVDQFEELYTLCVDSEIRQRFVSNLAGAIDTWSGLRKPSFSLVLTLRADFWEHALSHRSFADALQDSDLNLGPMTRRELRRAIENPAKRLGVTFEPGLVERILDEVGGQPGNLPLLEFALTLLWKQQMDGLLTHDSYEAIGGVTGALTHYADDVYGELSQAERERARRALLRMTHPGIRTRDTRRVARRTEFRQDEWKLVQRLANARLVVTSREASSGEETVEVAHEAMIWGWGRLREWMENDRVFRTWQDRLRVALVQWEETDHDDGALLRGVPLAEAKRWLAEREAELSPATIAFIQASTALEEREQGARALLRRRIMLGLAAGLVAAISLALLALGQRNEVGRQRQIALARQLAAQAVNRVDDLDLALLLSLEAIRLRDTAEVRGSLLSVLQANPRLRAFLHGHTGWVSSVAFSPDTTMLASASSDDTIILWDVATRRPIGEPLAGHTMWVNSVAFSPDGRKLASGGGDGIIILWDAKEGIPLRQPLTGHAQGVNSIAFSPEGSTLASGSSDNTVILWDVATGEPVGQPLTGHTGPVHSVAFSPDGQTVASGSEDHTIILWNVATGQPIGRPLTGHTLAVRSVAFSPDGQTLASGGWDRSVILWDVAARRPVSEPLIDHIDKVLSVAFSPDGRTLASGSADSTVILRDAATGKPIDRPLVGHTKWVWSVAFSQDGRMLASGSWDKSIILWDIEASQRLGQPLSGHTDEVLSLAFNPEGTVLASGSRDNSIILWDVAARQRLGQPLTGHTERVESLAFSPDGKTLASGGWDNTVILWDVATGRPIAQPLSRHTDVVGSVAFSPDGQLIASGGWDSAIILWDVETSQPIGQPLTSHTSGVGGVAFSPDGQTLASCGGDGAIILWDVATGQPIGKPLVDRTNWVRHDLAFSPDGRILASAGGDGTITLWDVEKEEPIGQPLTGHRSEVNCVAFSPDGKVLASGGRDNSVLLWDVGQGQSLGQLLAGHSHWVWGVAFSPDGSTLASCSLDGSIVLWNVNVEWWKAQACQVANRSLTLEEWRTYLGDEPYDPACAGRMMSEQ